MTKKVKEKNVSKILFFVFALILVGIVSTITITYAWFTDSASGGSNVTVTFGTVSVSGSTAEFLLSPTDLLPNYDGNNQSIPVSKSFSITNNGNVSIYTRFNATISIYNGQSVELANASSYISLSSVTPTSGDGSWQSNGGYYCYCTNSTTLKPLSASGIASATLYFTVDSSFGIAYAGKTVRVVFNIDGVQAANNSSALSSVNWS